MQYFIKIASLQCNKECVQTSWHHNMFLLLDNATKDSEYLALHYMEDIRKVIWYDWHSLDQGNAIENIKMFTQIVHFIVCHQV